MNPLVLMLAITSVTLNSMAQISMRKTMMTVGAFPARAQLLHFAGSVFLNPWFFAGMSCYALSIAVWLFVLAKIEVSLAYPLSSIGFLITAAIGYFYLGENVNMLRIVGIALIAGGIVAITHSA